MILLLGVDGPRLTNSNKIEGIFHEVSLDLEIEWAVEGKGGTKVDFEKPRTM